MRSRPAKAETHHQQGGTRQVEVGDHGVHRPEPVTRCDVQVRIAGVGREPVIAPFGGIRGHGFEHADGGRGNRNNPAARRQDLVDGAGRLLGQINPFGVDDVLRPRMGSPAAGTGETPKTW